MPYKLKTPKTTNELIIIGIYTLCSSVGILTFGALFVHWMWGIIGISLFIIVMLHFSSKAKYEFIPLQRCWKDEFGLDLSIYSLEWAKLCYKKFGEYDIKLVHLRIDELEKNILETSNKEKQMQLYKQIISICEFFDLKKKLKYYKHKFFQTRVKRINKQEDK